MSGLDPLAALAAQAAANAQAAIDAATLSIGADIPVLQSQISVGDVVAATVLPPQGGADLLSLLGQTVAAQIPPGINPGESLLLQVTAFTNNAVIVRNLGTVDPQNPVPTVDVQLPPQTPGAPQTAILTNAPPPSNPPQTQAPQTTVPPSQPPPANVAPPRAVFIAAAVRAAPNAPIPPEAVERANLAAATEAVSSDVEARIAAMRASSTPPAPSAQTIQAPVTRLPVAPPIVLPSSARVVNASAPSTPQPAQPAQLSVQPRAPQTPEEALLVRLRVPVTPTTLAAARAIENATTGMTSAYEKLDMLLARFPASQTPAALRSMLGFVSRMDLRNTAALPEQIAAFISDVVDGAEAKIAQAVQAWLALGPAAPRTAAAATPPAGQNAQAAPPESGASPESAPPPAAAVTTNAQAVASERVVALSFDPKSAMLAMLAEQPSTGASPALTGALRDAIVATTAVQLGTLSAQSNDPSAITLALPAYFYDGGSPVQLRISRDAPQSKQKMDADNFHIAFVLDTQSLGTIAIDVQTVGRAVSVDVKTQASLAADHIRTTLGDLRGRLERLRYRVANIGAAVAAPHGTPAPATPKAEPAPAARRSFWDMRA